MKLDLECREVARLLSESQERALPTARRARLRLHVVLCQACRDVEEQFAFVRRAMRRLDADEPPEP